MIPTIDLTGNLVVVERVSTCFRKVGPGDMVLLRSPENPRKHVIKRIIGMEGDTVTYLVKPCDSDECRTIVVFMCLILSFLFSQFLTLLSLGNYQHFHSILLLWIFFLLKKKL